MNSETEEDNTETLYGKCCFCGGECNFYSQSCGSCSRDMSMYGVTKRPNLSEFTTKNTNKDPVVLNLVDAITFTFDCDCGGNFFYKKGKEVNVKCTGCSKIAIIEG